MSCVCACDVCVHACVVCVCVHVLCVCMCCVCVHVLCVVCVHVLCILSCSLQDVTQQSVLSGFEKNPQVVTLMQQIGEGEFGQ